MELHRPDDVEATWAKVQPGVECLIAKDLDKDGGLTPQMYIEVYSAIYKYCISKKVTSVRGTKSQAVGVHPIGSELYTLLSNFLTEHLQSLLAHRDTSEPFLHFYVRSWNRYTLGAGYLNHVFDYLNRYWLKKERDSNKESVYDINTLCLVIWREVIFTPNLDELVKEILSEIEKQRDGEEVNKTEISEAIKSFITLGLNSYDSKKVDLTIYIEKFQTPFIAATREYFRKESAEFLAKNSVVDYMRKAETRLMEEKARSDLYLHSHSEYQLMKAVEDSLILDHVDLMLQEFRILLDRDQYNHMHRVYMLLCRVPSALAPLGKIFEEYVIQQGCSAVEMLQAELTRQSEAASAGTGVSGAGSHGTEPEKPTGKAGAAPGTLDPAQYVKTLLNVHNKYAKVVEDAFQSNSEFQKRFDDACTSFINKNVIADSGRNGASRTPELLAKYSDSLLRKKNKSATDGDDLLDDIMVIFPYIDDKSAFESYYRRYLAKRLINNLSVSEEAEDYLVNKLTQACGIEYTNKLQRMFLDMHASEELREQFRTVTADDPDSIDFSILVLSENMWPMSKTVTQFRLPEELKKTYNRLGELYGQNHSGRKLSWLWTHCKGEIKANVAKSSKVSHILQVSVFQMAILLPFNDRDSYSFEDLKAITGLESDYLSGSLVSLVKSKLLLAKPNKLDEISKPETVFTVNTDFKYKKVRVNLNVPLKIEQKHEDDETKKEIEEDRKLFLQATIVRVMKARKVLKHLALLNEVISISHSRFNAKVSDIKKCIDLLIEKDYLRRVENDTYEYVA